MLTKKKNMHYKGDKITILRGSKVRCPKPPKPVPDPKNQKIQNFSKIPPPLPLLLKTIAPSTVPATRSDETTNSGDAFVFRLF